MGWKTSAILIDRALELAPAALVNRLVAAPFSVVRTVTFEEAFNPKSTCVGKYGNSTIIFDPKWPGQIIRDGVSPILDRLFQTYPDANIAAVQLHGVVNLAAFRVFRAGKSVRNFMVTADDGVTLDDGAPIAAESRVLARYRPLEIGQDSTTLYVDEAGTQWTLDQLGEDIVFEVFRDFFGCRPDETDAFVGTLATEVAAQRSIWRRLFGGWF